MNTVWGCTFSTAVPSALGLTAWQKLSEITCFDRHWPDHLWTFLRISQIKTASKRFWQNLFFEIGSVSIEFVTGQDFGCLFSPSVVL